MYISGRTVKPVDRKPTTVASATREAQRLVAKHLPGVDGVTVNSGGTADPVTFASQIRTVITYPATADASDLACAVEILPDVVRSDWTAYAVTYWRAA